MQPTSDQKNSLKTANMKIYVSNGLIWVFSFTRPFKQYHNQRVRNTWISEHMDSTNNLKDKSELNKQYNKLFQ